MYQPLILYMKIETFYQVAGNVKVAQLKLICLHLGISKVSLCEQELRTSKYTNVYDLERRQMGDHRE